MSRAGDGAAAAVAGSVFPAQGREAPSRDQGCQPQVLVLKRRQGTVTEGDAGKGERAVKTEARAAQPMPRGHLRFGLLPSVPQVTAIRRGLASSALASTKVKTPSFISALILF